MYVHIFGYLVNKLEIWWVYLSPIEKRLHYKTIFNNVKHDMKKTWAIISDTLNKNSRSSLPETMTINGTTCHDKQVIADNFNRFFASIGEMNEPILLSIWIRAIQII